jgi:hypothetical protein
MASIHTGLSLDRQAKLLGMKKSPSAQEQYSLWCRRLSRLGYISQGSVQDRTARQGGGAGYQWTRKVAQKTVTVSLTAEQYAKMKEATSNYRRLRQQLKEMEMLSRRIIFERNPHPSRRKRLSPTVLGVM